MRLHLIAATANIPSIPLWEFQAKGLLGIFLAQPYRRRTRFGEVSHYALFNMQRLFFFSADVGWSFEVCGRTETLPVCGGCFSSLYCGLGRSYHPHSVRAQMEKESNMRSFVRSLARSTTLKATHHPRTHPRQACGGRNRHFSVFSVTCHPEMPWRVAN